MKKNGPIKRAVQNWREKRAVRKQYPKSEGYVVKKSKQGQGFRMGKKGYGLVTSSRTETATNVPPTGEGSVKSQNTLARVSVYQKPKPPTIPVKTKPTTPVKTKQPEVTTINIGTTVPGSVNIVDKQLKYKKKSRLYVRDSQYDPRP